MNMRTTVPFMLCDASAQDTVVDARYGDFHTSVYRELKKVAERRLRRWGHEQTLQPTELVHEVYMRMRRRKQLKLSQRAHFFGAAAQAMNHILVEHARKRGAQRRGGDLRRVELTLSVPTPAGARNPAEVLTVNAMLEQLRVEYPRHAQACLLSYFAGRTHSEIADLTGVSERTVSRRIAFACAWMRARA